MKFIVHVPATRPSCKLDDDGTESPCPVENEDGLALLNLSVSKVGYG